jgi:PLP dependent protein
MFDSAQLQFNIDSTTQRIADACMRSGRAPNDIRLVAVSKTKSLEAIQAAIELGQCRFGENRVQELVPKATALPNAEWHFVGSLQRNKVKFIAPFIHLIHSLDSISLADEIEKQAKLNKRSISCLIQVNISNEIQKGGINPDYLPTLLNHIILFCPNVFVVGFMAVGQETTDMQLIKSQFDFLNELLFHHSKDNDSPNVLLKELSIGMSNDFELAISCGATIVRIGSSIFGTR